MNLPRRLSPYDDQFARRRNHRFAFIGLLGLSRSALFALSVFLLTATSFAASPLQYSLEPAIRIEDQFGRRLNEHGITLIEFDGQVASPALQHKLRPIAAALAFPIQVTLRADDPHVYFDLPSDVNSSGPSKALTITDASAAPEFYIAFYPDHDAANVQHKLTLQFTDAVGNSWSDTVALNVLDLRDTARTAAALPFSVIVDFSKDKTGFFADSQKQAIVTRAADDWAYFIGDMKLDRVARGSETTLIWGPDGFVNQTSTTNKFAYRGFLLYAYGIHSVNLQPEELRSGGEASAVGGFQTSHGTPLKIRRSGGLEVETQGNYNSLGWFVSLNPADWWRTQNLGGEQNDLYSIVHHEIGHALFFDSPYPVFDEAKRNGQLVDPAILAYHHSYPNVNADGHFAGAIDDASKMGAFGNEYFGSVPRRRWTITKLDLLAAQAIGYKLYPSPTFRNLTVKYPSLPNASVGQPYAASADVSGGTPPYYFTVSSGGVLPAGLALNSFTGAIEGVPNAPGSYTFKVATQDTGGQSLTSAPLTIRSTGPAVALSPGTVSFPKQVVGSRSVLQTVVLRNSGNAPLHVSGASIAGQNAGEFIARNACGVLKAGASCSIAVSFAPTGTAARSATLVIQDDAGNSPQAVPLSGIGVASCDVNGDGAVTVSDVQLVINQSLGTLPPSSDINGDGVVDSSDVQLVVNAVLGQGCSH